ncbi:MAG: hypothetical protein RB292_02130 [Patescibacteria group bacterium]|jgi:hypothetical protein|nr:hypothetical protein [Patescibacteria group bacterium]
MRFKFILFFAIFISVFLASHPVWAEETKVIFDFPSFVSGQAGETWQIFNNSDEGLYPQDEGLLLHNDGDAYLIYNQPFGYDQFNNLMIELKVNRPLVITLTADIQTLAQTSFEFQRALDPSDDYQVINFSLRHRFFKNVKEFGINLHSAGASDVVVKQIKLEAVGAGIVKQAVSDYWRMAPYSPYTVNLFPAPLIFGHPGFIVFIPVLTVLILLVIYFQRWRKWALILLVALWLITDLRMAYEFLNYHLVDYRSYLSPSTQVKSFRNYGDFYQFADWVESHCQGFSNFNFYSFGSSHLPRILTYLVYPLDVLPSGNQTKATVVYNRQDIKYNDQDSRLYNQQGPITDPGEIIAVYNDDSFIFIEQ